MLMLTEKNIDNIGFLATLGIIFYLANLALPINPKIPLVVLAISGAILITVKEGLWIRQTVLIFISISLFLVSSVTSYALNIGSDYSLLPIITWFPALYLFFLISTRLSFNYLNLMIWSLVLSGGVFSSVVLFIAATHPNVNPATWMQLSNYSQFSVPNDLLFLSLLAPFNIYLISKHKLSLITLVAVFCCVASLGAIIVIQSRGALLTMILSLTVTTGLLYPKKSLLAFSGIIVAAALLDGVLGFELSGRFISTFQTRIPLWYSAFNMFLDAPVFGHGPGSFSVMSDNYRAMLDLPKSMMIDSRHTPWAHSLYLELLAERGVLGLVTFLAYLFIVSTTAWKMFRMKISLDSYRLSSVTLGFIAAFLFCGLFELSLLRHWTVILVCVVPGILILKEKSLFYNILRTQKTK